MHFKPIKVTDKVFWVGAVDWKLRNFHGYTTYRGSTYNAYLIMDEKITLVDTVKAPFKEQIISRISELVDPERISYIISNHSEMDHSGLLPDMVKLIKPEKVFVSTMGAKALSAQFHWDVDVEVVKSGDRISLGESHITFLETRMLHWPDSMFSYLEEEKLLFSQDAFGMHLATDRLFADEREKDILEFEAATYYANILMPYSDLVLKLFDKVKDLGISPEIVAPDHGPIYRRKEDIEWIMTRYKEWAEQKPTKRVLVVYDTMWGSTEKMAYAIGEGASELVDVKVVPIQGSTRSDVAYEVLISGAVAFGAPTLNNNMFPSMADVLTYIKGLRPKNLLGAAFGSYGWSGESVEQIKKVMEEMGIKVIGEVKSRYVPDEALLEECRGLGKKLAEELIKVCSG